MSQYDQIPEIISHATLQFFVRELDGRQFEYFILKESKGLQLLKNILDKHYITDTSYFGLKYTNNKGVTKWINTRNSLLHQVDNPDIPIKLELAIKFYLPVNLLRDYHLKKSFLSQLKSDIINRNLTPPTDTEDALRFLALFAQAEHGSYFKQISYITPPSFNMTTELIEEHKLIQYVPKMEALDEVLKIASELSTYGKQEFQLKDGLFTFSPHTCEYSLGNTTKTFATHLIKDVTRSYSNVFLSMSNFEQSDSKIKLKTNSIIEGKILHKNLLETVTFFTRSSVSDVIRDTTCKQWRGSRFVSTFAFDLIHTCYQLNPSLYTLKLTDADPTTHCIQSRVVNKVNSEEFKLYKVCSLPEVRRIVKKKMSLSNLYRRYTCNGSCENSQNSSTLTSESNQSLISTTTVDEVIQVADKMLRCKLCDARDCKVLFLPCCHFISCEGCSDTRNSCLECNEYITERVRVYIS